VLLLTGRYDGVQALIGDVAVAAAPPFSPPNVSGATRSVCSAPASLKPQMMSVRMPGAFRVEVASAVLADVVNWPDTESFGRCATTLLTSPMLYSGDEIDEAYLDRIVSSGTDVVIRVDYQVGWDYLWSLARQNVSADRLDVINGLADELLQRDTMPTRAHLERGFVATQSGHPDVVRREMDILIGAGDLGEAVRLAGMAASSDTTESSLSALFERLDRVLGLDPEQVMALYHMGRIGALTGRDTERSIQALEAYIERTPDGPPARAAGYSLIGQNLEQRAAWRDAAAAYSRAIELNPSRSADQARLDSLRERGLIS
jgi:hypothetical protein